MPSADELSSYLYMAAAEPLGLWLHTPNPSALRVMLNSLRNKLGDPSLAHLQFRISRLRPECELWIVNAPSEE